MLDPLNPSAPALDYHMSRHDVDKANCDLIITICLQVLRQMSWIAMQRSLKMSRWNSLSKKRSPKLRSSPEQLCVIFPSERLPVVTSEENKSY